MSLADDLRFGARMLLKQPGLSAIAILALSLGIGLTTIMFSIVNGALIRGLPFQESERLVVVSATNVAENEDRLNLSIHDFTDWREAQRSLEDLAAFYAGTVNVSGEGRPDRFNGAFVTANTFDVVRVRPFLGRGFVKNDDSPGAPMTIVLGYGPWQRRFGGDPNVVGKTLRVNGRPATIIGVMPDRFAFPAQQEVWVPLQLDPLALKRGEGTFVMTFGRVKPGVTIAIRSAGSALALTSAVRDQVSALDPDTPIYFARTLQEGLDEGAWPFRVFGALFMAFGVSALLLATVGLYGVMAFSVRQRTQEIGVRMALGARGAVVLGMFMRQGLWQIALGLTLGLGLGAGLSRLMSVMLFRVRPWDPVVFAAIAVTLATAALVACLVPARRAMRVDPLIALRYE